MPHMRHPQSRRQDHGQGRGPRACRETALKGCARRRLTQQDPAPAPGAVPLTAIQCWRTQGAAYLMRERRGRAPVAVRRHSARSPTSHAARLPHGKTHAFSLCGGEQAGPAGDARGACGDPPHWLASWRQAAWRSWERRQSRKDLHGSLQWFPGRYNTRRAFKMGLYILCNGWFSPQASYIASPTPNPRIWEPEWRFFKLFAKTVTGGVGFTE